MDNIQEIIYISVAIFIFIMACTILYHYQELSKRTISTTVSLTQPNTIVKELHIEDLYNE